MSTLSCETIDLRVVHGFWGDVQCLVNPKIMAFTSETLATYLHLSAVHVNVFRNSEAILMQQAQGRS